VQLQGFVELVDAVGGISVTVPEAVYDARYPLENGRGYVEVYIRAGKQHMNGRRALMYARTRHQDSDYGRMRRQQVVLEAIGTKLMKEPLLVRLPELLEIARDNLWTNLRTSDLPDLVALAERVDLEGIANVRFIPPTYPEYLDGASIKQIRRVVDRAFDDAAPLATPAPAAPPRG
jgi:anionic cell wall polymer biosynthesis LytR-Cps2A-Psr (LCP) family protein